MADLYIAGARKGAGAPSFEAVRVFNGRFFENEIIPGLRVVSLEKAITLARSDLVAYLLSEDPVISFRLGLLGAEGQWKAGAEVLVEKIDGAPWVKLLADGQARDNLGDLPVF